MRLKIWSNKLMQRAVEKSVTVAFVDTETDFKGTTLFDIGGIKSDGATFHRNSLSELGRFIRGSQFVCGHNIINHDIKYIGTVIADAGIPKFNVIDTLYFSPLLFPTKPYHSLVKDDKLQSDDLNNPLNDSIKTKDLFYDEIAAFRQTDEALQQIYFLLLHDTTNFQAFFRYLSYSTENKDVGILIQQRFHNSICEHVNLNNLIDTNPVELAYCLALINSMTQFGELQSVTPPWVLKNFPDVQRIMFLLRNKPCLTGCAYCNEKLDVHKGLKRFFGYDTFRLFDGQSLQEQAVKAAIDNKSLLAVFPTGGGKSITFQLPALISGEASGSLTVVISPLQSLMKDQVDNLEKKGITSAVTINGLLDPIERAKSFERVENGSASILYLSPESLRSRSIERLIIGRKIARFVIDEAHCFSAWGQDFRVDYLYIGDFLKSVQEKKNLDDPIPVSCFTATAKTKVIEEIQTYFQDKLSLHLELFTSKMVRTNLHYRVFKENNEEEKYQMVRELLEENRCSTIIYVSRTKKAYLLAERLTKDGYGAKPYHGKMEVKEKSANQDAFMSGEVSVMVATSAFGMGVDKKDVGMVIHYDISDSLENYIQEAGRAGRDEHIMADCYLLFNEEDLNKHFILLNQTKISIKEIQQIWKAVKELTRVRATVSNSALEIARKAGWDDSVLQIENRVTTAIAALEDAGYLKRGQNTAKVFANSILAKNAQEAIDKINASNKFDENQKMNAIRIIKSLISSKNRKSFSEEVPESRIDYLSDYLGIAKAEIIQIVDIFREEKILADAKDLTAFLKKNENINRSLSIVETYCQIEDFLIQEFDENEKSFNLKELNEKFEKILDKEASLYKISTLINFWTIKNWIKRKRSENKNMIAVMSLLPKETLKEKLDKRHALSNFVVSFLYKKSMQLSEKEQNDKKEVPVQFSVQELKNAYEQSSNLFKVEVSMADVEDTLFFLSRIEAIKIEGGFMVLYNSLTIERTEQNNKKQYTKENYQKFNQYYENKIQQIHIVGEYAEKMLNDYKEALQFVNDYFQLNYASFLSKYFKGSRQNEITKNITPAKFRQLFGELSPTQLKIINDKDSKYIVVAAGPGSGKTRVLVHKLASLLLMEDVKHEQLLMLTFSRAAATEFKNRLENLIGKAANYIEIKTFHSYCFDLLGKIGSLDKMEDLLSVTIEKINQNEVEISRITKTVLVIDEAQDMSKQEFALVYALMQQNEEMRVIAVGDDDQNIYEFRGSSSQYFQQFITELQATKYELVDNYRSKANLVNFTNQFVQQIRNRMKRYPIVAKQYDNGGIKIVHHASSHLIIPMVNEILTSNLAGTTCVLTRTNEEALQITGLLLKNQMPAKLVQSNDGFNLYNLLEIRYFLCQLNLPESTYVINDELWNNAKNKLNRQFYNSPNLPICNNLIRNFESLYQNAKYKSDLEVYIQESNLADFFQVNSETIWVSTMHKAKGKEFDNLFLMLKNYNSQSDEAKRVLYVAMTRAKQKLCIHLNTNLLDDIFADSLTKIEDRNDYNFPDELVMQLSFKDVWLDYFGQNQNAILQLKSGDVLIVDGSGCRNQNCQSVLKFSHAFTDKINSLKKLNYELSSAKVHFMVYWKKEDADNEILIILPEVYFKRNG